MAYLLNIFIGTMGIIISFVISVIIGFFVAVVFGINDKSDKGNRTIFVFCIVAVISFIFFVSKINWN
jgi:hypothetical protein